MRVTLSKTHRQTVTKVQQSNGCTYSEALEIMINNYMLSIELLRDRGKIVSPDHNGFYTADNVVNLLEERIQNEKGLGFTKVEE